MGSEYASKINPSLITVIIILIIVSIIQKQPSIGVLKKSYFENMQQVYRGTPMPKCNFNKVAKQLYWNHTSACVSPANLLHVFRTPFLRTHMEGYFWLFYKTFHAHSRKQHYVKKFTQPLVWIISNIFNVTDILPVFVLLTLKRSLAQCLKVTRSTQRAAAWRNSMTRLF